MGKKRRDEEPTQETDEGLQQSPGTASVSVQLIDWLRAFNPREECRTPTPTWPEAGSRPAIFTISAFFTTTVNLGCSRLAAEASARWPRRLRGDRSAALYVHEAVTEYAQHADTERPSKAIGTV